MSEAMFGIGDYVKHVDYPKVILKIRGEMEKAVTNAHADDYEHATEDEIKEYLEGES